MNNNIKGFYPSRLLLLICAVALGFSFGQTVLAAPGDLDPTFGTNGRVIGAIPGTQAANDVAVQPDGKIVLASATSGVNGYSDFAVLRLNANGTPDTSFGSGGKAVVTFGDLYNETAVAVVVQPDNKIIVAGVAQPGSTGYDFAVARFNSDGSLDNSFGGGGKVSFPVGIGGDSLSDAILQPDGKIILVGGARTQPNSDAAVVRLNADGSLDATFNGNGKLITPIGSGAANDYAAAVVLQPDGKILVAGTNGEDFAVLRFNSNGSFDTTFDGDGKATTPVGTQRDTGRAIALQADGKIIVGGAANSGSGDRAALVRYNPDGSLDASFGNGGKLSLTFPATFISVIIAADGKIVAVGTGGDQTFTGDFTLARFNQDGVLDSTFGNGGKATTTNGNNNITAYAAAAQADGKIIVAGSGVSNSVYSFAVARYLMDASAIRSTAFDYDGDGRADVSVFRPSNNVWYLNRSAQGFTAVSFGNSGDVLAPADYDGDGKTDVAVFRPSNGTWYWINSSNNTLSAVGFGAGGDVPAPADYDGDGRADVCVFRPGNGTWYRLNSGANNAFVAVQFGADGDQPTNGDFDGDGKADIAVWRPSNGVWYRLNSRDNSFYAAQFGASGDRAVPADFDGDGKTDLSVFRPSNNVWYRLNSTDNSLAGVGFGTAGDVSAAADYDGDGRADIAVYRPSSGSWFILQSQAGFSAQQFGATADVPTPSAFVR